MWSGTFHKVFKSYNSPWALSFKKGKLHWTSAAQKKGRTLPTVCQSVILHFNTFPQAFFICLYVSFSSCTLRLIKDINCGLHLRCDGFWKFHLKILQRPHLSFKILVYCKVQKQGHYYARHFLDKAEWKRECFPIPLAEWQPKTQLEKVGLQCHRRQQVSRHLKSEH